MKRNRKMPPPSSARLFEESRAAAPARIHMAQIDGASRGNPGPAAYAVVLRGPEGKPLFELGKSIGRETNNVAEYYGLIAALDYAASHAIRALRIRSDSELLVRQMQGRYKVKSAELRPLFERARKLAASLEYFAIEHVPREANRDADALANAALDRTAEGGAPPSKQAPTHRAMDKPRRIRARYSGGALIPHEALDFPENSEVEIEIRISKIP